MTDTQRMDRLSECDGFSFVQFSDAVTSARRCVILTGPPDVTVRGEGATLREAIDNLKEKA